MRQQQPSSTDMERLFRDNPDCDLERATGFNVWCRTHRLWNAHDPAELERIAKYVAARRPSAEGK